MTEQLISLETAKLAKEKGFDWNPGKAYYTTLGEHDMSMKYDYNNPHHYAMTSQSLLAKWLRDKHNLYVNANPVIYAGDEKASYFQSSLNTNIILYKERFDTYEDALEASLKYALNLIK